MRERIFSFNLFLNSTTPYLGGALIDFGPRWRSVFFLLVRRRRSLPAPAWPVLRFRTAAGEVSSALRVSRGLGSALYFIFLRCPLLRLLARRALVAGFVHRLRVHAFRGGLTGVFKHVCYSLSPDFAPLRVPSGFLKHGHDIPDVTFNSLRLRVEFSKRTAARAYFSYE